MNLFAIILINSYNPESTTADEIRLHNSGYPGAKLLIPTVRLLKHVIYHKETYEFKPLLFRYGFIELPYNYAISYEILQDIKNLTTTIKGYVMRRKNDLEQERLKTPDKPVPQILVESITSEEVNRLFNVAKSISVYDSHNELAIGNFVILKGYPFDNLAAEVVAKYGGTIKVKLLSTGYTVQVQEENLYYSPYQDENPTYKEVCFTELGYVPDV